MRASGRWRASAAALCAALLPYASRSENVTIGFGGAWRGLFLPSTASGALQGDASLWTSCDAFGGFARLYGYAGDALGGGLLLVAAEAPDLVVLVTDLAADDAWDAAVARTPGIDVVLSTTWGDDVEDVKARENWYGETVVLVTFCATCPAYLMMNAVSKVSEVRVDLADGGVANASVVPVDLDCAWPSEAWALEIQHEAYYAIGSVGLDDASVESGERPTETPRRVSFAA
ncbi:hypothetical protein JL722_1479 [Aureococcus anophagefferens]|nr:hypothetical protein JL722_1479 [Aureococcus anophagefferens]